MPQGSWLLQIQLVALISAKFVCQGCFSRLILAMAIFPFLCRTAASHPEPPTPPAAWPGEPGASLDFLDTRRPARAGFLALGLGLGGFLLWAALAPLDEGVPTEGVVALDTKRKAVQPPAGGIVRAVHVREGQVVEAGAPLIELDSEEAEAELEAVRQRYFTQRAGESRLAAERAGADAIEFPADLQAAAKAGRFAKLAMEGQQRLFASRRAALAAELAALDESVAGEKASIVGWQGLLSSRKTQLGYLQEELAGLRPLAAEGYAPRNQLLGLERQAAEAAGAVAELQGNIARARRAIAEAGERRAQRIQEQLKEFDTQYAELWGAAQADKEAFEAAKGKLAHMVVRAPAAGQVVGLAVQTVGGVVAAGEKLMDIVPEGEPLLLETRVPPQMADRVHAGLPADARFAAFAHTPQLVVAAKVESISADLLADPQTGVPYYLARVAVTPEGQKALGGRRLQPGMPAEVVLITGERSLLTYLLGPLLRRLAFSLKEE
jgi:protease secretion system membrane fusion protein